MGPFGTCARRFLKQTIGRTAICLRAAPGRIIVVLTPMRAIITPTRLVIATAAAAALVALVYLAAFSGGGASDRDLVRVSGQGFTVVAGSKLTYAFIVENGSDEEALEGARYEVRFFGDSGSLIASRDGDLPLVLPKAKAAIAEESIDVGSEPVDMTVVITAGRMRRAAGLPALLPANITQSHTPGVDGGRADATASIWNPFAVELSDIYVASVYSDADGRIVGGGSTVVDRLAPGAQSETIALENGPGSTVRLQQGSRVSYPARPVFHPAPLGTVAELEAARAGGEALPEPGPPAVRWAPAEAPSFWETEDPAPFDTPSGGPASMVYVVEGDAEPRLLHETGRWLSELEWRPNGESLLVAARSKKIDPPPEARGPYYIQALEGLLELDARDGAVKAEWMQEVTHDLFRSPANDQVVLEASDGKLYLLEPDGRSLELTGLGDRLVFAGWSPKGDSILVFSYETIAHPHPVDGRFYVVPLSDGEAARVDPPLDHFQRETAAWSPEGSRFAFVAGAQFNDFEGWRAIGDVYVFDVGIGVTSRVTTDRGYGSRRPAWSEDGRWLSIRGDLINPASGLVADLAVPPVHAQGGVVSPDGRHFLVTEEPGLEAPANCPPGGLQNRTRVYDTLTDTERVLLDCEDGFFLVDWWDAAWIAGGRYVVLRTPNCYGCEPTTNRLTLLDIESGTLRPLETGEQWWVDAVASPDGRRLVTTGNALRILDAHGALLRTIAAPDGYVVRHAAWSPDGAKIAYVIVAESIFEGV
jgi:dipeptidyl aminopeptidase/acylaminoacyl peptidase